MAAEHHHPGEHHHPPREESDLGTGLLGMGIALVWLAIVIWVSHLMALALH